MRSPVLYFFLLVIKVFFDFIPNVVNKRGRFFKTLLEKCFAFVLNKGSDPILLNLSFMLLPMEVDPISEKQGCKEDTLVAYNIGRIEIVFTLPIKVVILYM